jgi:hypothetical protein
VLAAVGLASTVASIPLAVKAARGPVEEVVSPHGRSAPVDLLQTAERAGTWGGDGDSAALALDGREDTGWVGSGAQGPWRWATSFARPVHVGLLRAHFGHSPTSGIPRQFHWEVLAPMASASACPASPADTDDWTELPDTRQAVWQAGAGVAGTTRRSWFVDADACGLRLVVDRTNAGPPVLREVRAIASARDVLRDGHASDEGVWPGFSADAAIDGRYATRWAGNPGTSRWVLRVDLAAPQPIDRVRLVLGFDATGVPRAGYGRSYAIAWAPLRYRVEISEDGTHFEAVAAEPRRNDGSILPVRRRLVTLPRARNVRAVRLVMVGATGADGIPDPAGVPVVREIAAYRADDPHPVLAPPWILSINANPSGQTHTLPGGELVNDIEHAKFLQGRFAKLLPALWHDDRYARLLGPRSVLLDRPPTDGEGEAIESIEGDDPQLDEQLLRASDPPPIAILGGSNDWDYAAATGADAAAPRRWHWDPLTDARLGGMGRVAGAVRHRAAPFLGFCGGAQILALLEAREAGEASADDDHALIDRVLSRTSGLPIRGFASTMDIEHAWPGDPQTFRERIEFPPDDPLFADLAGASLRASTGSLPESHSDALRADAFDASGPLGRLKLVATSTFCAPDVEASGTREGIFPNPSGAGWCTTVPEAFRSRDHAWPVIGTQFHPEQHEFATAAPGDPPESTADPRLFVAGAYEEIVDAYAQYSP